MGERITMQGPRVQEAPPAQTGTPMAPVGGPPTTSSAVFSGMNTSQTFGVLGSIDSVRGEVDDAFADMKTFHNLEPDQVMRMCGGHSARLQEIRVQIMRLEVIARQWKPVRTNEVEPAIEELKQQYLIASRLHSVRELDYKIATGGT